LQAGPLLDQQHRAQGTYETHATEGGEQEHGER
jgi:hypothetical protein